MTYPYHGYIFRKYLMFVKCLYSQLFSHKVCRNQKEIILKHSLKWLIHFFII